VQPSQPREGRRRGGAARETFAAGVAAGVLGAVAMMAWMMGASALDGDSALAPLRAVGTTFRGPEALQGGAGTIAWGVALHLLIGAALGVAFAAIVPRDMELQSGMILGAGVAILVMAVAIQVVLPRVAPLLRASMPRHGGAWVIAHAIYGAVAGIAPWLRRRIGGGVPGRVEPLERTPALRPRTSP
jgi:hypothetical protein